MSASNFSATAAAADIVDEDWNRTSVLIQLLSGDPVSIGIGEDAVYGKGVTLLNVGDCVVIRGGDAKRTISAICDTANSASGGVQEGGDIMFFPGAPTA